MTFRFVINGEELEQQQLEELLSSYNKSPLEYSFIDSDHGNDPAVCAGWSTYVIDILALASLTFFAIPAATKKIRDACKEWKQIYIDLNSFLDWFSSKEEISSYSMDVVFLDALAHLDSKTDANELNLVHHLELPQSRFESGSNFYLTTDIYYQFVFENTESGRIYMLLYNSQRKLLIDGNLGMYMGQSDDITCF